MDKISSYNKDLQARVAVEVDVTTLTDEKIEQLANAVKTLLKGLKNNENE